MKVGIGKDSHRFLKACGEKFCIIGGVLFPDVPGWDADSDGDIAFHAICNAITSITHVPILGGIALSLCKKGIVESKEYLLEAKKTLLDKEILHLSLAIETKRPRLQTSIFKMRQNIATLLNIDLAQVGITCTSGNELTDIGKGLGGQAICLLTIK